VVVDLDQELVVKMWRWIGSALRSSLDWLGLRGAGGKRNVLGLLGIALLLSSFIIDRDWRSLMQVLSVIALVLGVYLPRRRRGE